jgi:hypothetical protein
MANQETPTTVTERKPNGKFTNVRDLVWPHDEYGFTSMLRKEGARAIGRIKGDPKKLEVLIQSLRVLADHATTKAADQKVVVSAQVQAAEQRAIEAEAAALAQQRAEVERLRGVLVSAEAELAAKEPAPEADAAGGE